MTWDGAASPSVDVPVGYFFGNADCGNDPATRFSSLPLGLTPTEAYPRFPMPFAKGAVLELANDSSVAIGKIEIHLAVEKRSSLPKNWGRFHATWNEERIYGDDFKKLQRYQNVPVHTVRLSGSADHFFTPHVFPTGAATSFAVITQQTRIYANPAAIVKLAVFPTSNSSTTTCSISMSGHLTGSGA